jgi:hypothetical protein
MFKEVRRLVIEDTRGAQVPWDNSSLIGDFYFLRTAPRPDVSQVVTSSGVPLSSDPQKGTPAAYGGGPRASSDLGRFLALLDPVTKRIRAQMNLDTALACMFAKDGVERQYSSNIRRLYPNLTDTELKTMLQGIVNCVSTDNSQMMEFRSLIRIRENGTTLPLFAITREICEAETGGGDQGLEVAERCVLRTRR